MVDVFISYARANRDIVCRLAGAIGRLGYVVWWDEELPAHLSYGEVITQKIAEAKATLVDLVRESAASEWVRAEADMATQPEAADPALRSTIACRPCRSTRSSSPRSATGPARRIIRAGARSEGKPRRLVRAGPETSR